MELNQQNNKNSNSQSHQPIENINQSKSIPLKEYEYINYLENQIEEFSGLDDQNKWYQYCLRIGYYLQKVHGIEILKMNSEFIFDEDGVLWFTFASNICVRFKKNSVSNENLKKIKNFN